MADNGRRMVGKVAIVTGAAMGEAHARRIAAEGTRVHRLGPIAASKLLGFSAGRLRGPCGAPDIAPFPLPYTCRPASDRLMQKAN